MRRGGAGGQLQRQVQQVGDAQHLDSPMRSAGRRQDQRAHARGAQREQQGATSPRAPRRRNAWRAEGLRWQPGVVDRVVLGPGREAHRRGEHQQRGEFLPVHCTHSKLVDHYSSSTDGQYTQSICIGLAYDTDRTPMLTRTSSPSLTAQLADRLAERIRNAYCCRAHGCPRCASARTSRARPYTVVAAYDQLLALGLCGGAAPARLLRARFVAIRPRPGPAARRPAADQRAVDGHADDGLAGRRQLADPRHVPPPERQAAARHGRVPARLDRFARSCRRRVRA